MVPAPGKRRRDRARRPATSARPARAASPGALVARRGSWAAASARSAASRPPWRPADDARGRRAAHAPWRAPTSCSSSSTPAARASSGLLRLRPRDDARDRPHRRRGGRVRAARSRPRSTPSARCRRSGPRSTPTAITATVSFSARLPKDRLTLAEMLSGAGRSRPPASSPTRSPGRPLRVRPRLPASSTRSSSDLGSRGDVLPQGRCPPGSTKNKDRRFFAYVHFREPHFPYDPQPPFDTRFGPEGPIPKAAAPRRRLHPGREPGRGGRSPTAERDRAPRAALRRQPGVRRPGGRAPCASSLEAEGLWEKTVVIVAADHGEGLLEHGWIGHNVQRLRAEARTCPLIVRFPKGAGPAGDQAQRARGPARRRADHRRRVRRPGQGRRGPRVPGPEPPACSAGAPGQAAVLSRTVWDRPRYALARRAVQVHLRHAHGPRAALRPRQPTRARRATWRPRSRCGRPTTARRCTSGRPSVLRAAAPRAEEARPDARSSART